MEGRSEWVGRAARGVGVMIGWPELLGMLGMLEPAGRADPDPRQARGSLPGSPSGSLDAPGTRIGRSRLGDPSPAASAPAPSPAAPSPAAAGSTASGAAPAG